MKRFYLIFICICSVIALPIILWFLEPEKRLNIAIIDKTVPNDTYREHLGITWVLNNLKYVNSKDEEYDSSTDYFGFVPDEKKESYEIKHLPTNYSDFDVIYLADTYGVYNEDLPWIKKDREGSRSSKIYGGLEEAEWSAIIDRLNEEKKSLLVAEYNTFASPTNQGVREGVSDYLGLEWSGWVGRYFDELDPDKNSEIPQWILDEFQDTWKYSGVGFVLVNDDTSEVIVLEKKKHFKDEGIHIAFTEEGEKKFGLTKSPDYQYWFDIVTPENDTKVLANYKWDLTEHGIHLLNENEVPIQFAAVLENEHRTSPSYYFAGDFNDIAKVPTFYQLKGLQHLYKIGQTFSEDTFYWSVYVPMMKKILEDFTNNEDVATSFEKTNELHYNARVQNDSFEILKDDEWTPMTIKGVNIGMAKPGVFPGEAGITEDEYYRWLEQIGEMNANAIRVYTLHPPGFYNALKRYNEKHDEKIYVFHGVWINEEKLAESLDAFEEGNLQDFQDEIKTLIDVIHGNKIVEAEAGHASGVYRADISEYVIGWILGIEWYPQMVLNTNETYRTIGEYEGEYFETKGATAFEYWLAEQMDLTVKYEKDNYNWIRPMSFTNWITTDILEHPAEPSEDEDLVGVDPNVIYAKEEMDLTNQFASYHVYPYYPDFLNFEESYQTYVDHRGEFNSYAAYLNELHEAHRLPVLIAEFGVPASRGLTHENPFGWNQGFHSETEQGEIITRLFEDIMAEKLLGGLVFTWQDEWFKRTWNTVDYDNPDRRPFWSNAQTNEQQFGLLSFDRLKINVDGNKEDWETDALYDKKEGDLHSLYVDHDERYLYIRLDHDVASKGYPIFLLDIVPNQGNKMINGTTDISFTNGMEFIISLKNNESSLFVDRYYDFFTNQYGHTLDLLKPKPSVPTINSGEFTIEQYALNKELYLPQQNITLPFSSYDTGKLIEGNSNPLSEDYNSLADYYMNEDGMIELRIPWLLIHAKDPSQKEFMGDLYADGTEASTFVEEIKIGALYFNEQDELTDSVPAIESDVLNDLKGYTWENWDLPKSEERLKQSYYMLQKLFLNY
ncbi:hypothetical protein [Sporosarcina beigongshangi]|uniref:hypothetical protein n=1 Tax=Sporosarcina beigongshangi TaxID=2782538 RepID=UPI00193AC82A|nr:hypothetical protein [Sporosarcina beigongshangi]